MHILSGRSLSKKSYIVCISQGSPEKKKNSQYGICVNIYYRKPDHMDMEIGEFNIFSQQAGDLGEPVVLFYLTCKTEERRLSASLKTDSLRQRTNCCSVFFLYPGF